MASKIKDYGNEIIIAEKPAEMYVYAIIKSLQPKNYEKYGKIKIQVMESNLPLADYIIRLFTTLWLEEQGRIKKKMKITKEDGESYSLEVIEITLVKHPKLRR